MRAFLVSRRARVDPTLLGKARGKRRTPGLRREEVAELAGVSVDWYEMLETGRAQNVSARTLFAVAKALRLDEFETAHLFTLSGYERPYAGHPATEIPLFARLIVEGFTHGPALITNRCYDVLLANSLGETVLNFGDLALDNPRSSRNAVLRFFTDPQRRTRWRDRERIGRSLVADLRHRVSPYANEADVASLLAELLQVEDFASYWNEQDVTPHLGTIGVIDAADGPAQAILLVTTPIPGTLGLQFNFGPFVPFVGGDA